MRRQAFTLLEVLLSLAIAALLLAGLYAAINIQLKQAQVNRELIEQSTLARALLNRISIDINSAVALPDPARYRAASQQAGAAGGGGTGAADAASTASGATGATTDTGAATDGSEGATPPAEGSIMLPSGVQGDSTSLTLFVSKVPREAFPTGSEEAAIVTSDLRRITYWLAAEGGLARQEIKVVTSDEASAAAELPTGGDEAGLVIAPEVRGLTFEYFDGSDWQGSWDSNAMGADGVTPMGSPRLIRITIEIARPNPSGAGDEVLKKYHHTVFIPTANGASAASTGGGDAP